MKRKITIGIEPLDVDLVVAPTTLTKQDLAVISDAIRQAKASRSDREKRKVRFDR